VRRREIALLEESRIVLLEQCRSDAPTDEVSALRAQHRGQRRARHKCPDVDGRNRLRRNHSGREQQCVARQKGKQQTRLDEDDDHHADQHRRPEDPAMAQPVHRIH
jgi:hypothetical protein